MLEMYLVNRQKKLDTAICNAIFNIISTKEKQLIYLYTTIHGLV